jgi:hypothetical protein
MQLPQAGMGGASLPSSSMAFGEMAVCANLKTFAAENLLDGIYGNANS